jgi:protein-disulfide isomerase
VASKKGKNRVLASKRGSKRRSGGRQSGLKIYGLIIGVIAVAVVVVAAVAIFGQPQVNSPAHPVEASLDKSEGAPDAPVVVMEYADFQCPYCRQFATGPERQLKTDYIDPGQVRFVFRQMPFIGEESLWAAEASECANEQGRFWDYHDKLFAEQTGENEGAFSLDNLKGFAADLNLNTEQFNHCLDSGKYRDKVQQEMIEGQRLGVTSTPTIFVNGQLIRQGSDYQVLRTAIEAALAAGKS